MRRALALFKILVAIPIFAILALSGWLALVHPEILPLASAYAAKMVCSNVFIAKRDANAVIRTDVEFREGSIVKFMTIDVDHANRRVEAVILGLFAKRYAAYVEGRGCTLVSKNEAPDRDAEPPLPPLAKPDGSGPRARGCNYPRTVDCRRC
jgi:hypothetical protein